MRNLFLLLLAVPCLASADIHYSATIEPEMKSVRVTMKVDSKGEPLTFRIPAWCPGFYTLKNYEREISDVKATRADGTTLNLSHTDPRAWTVEPGKPESVTLSYRITGNDSGLGFFGVHVRRTSAFLNGPAAFMYVDGRKTEKCTLKLGLPKDWDYATAMERGSDGVFSAPEYDEFIDHPIECGILKKAQFTSGGIPFEVAASSMNGQFPNMALVARELALLTEPVIRMFGGAPFKRYVFIIHLGAGEFAGGLEHRASCVMAITPSDPLDLGSLATHEFFHAWNVKQIRPKVLGPFDYTQKVRTGNLWFAEGVTDYYAHMLTYESGVEGEGWLFQALSYEIDTLQSSDTRLQKTLEQVCKETWESGGFGAGDLSYYTKGLVVGLILDAAIRDATNGVKSLDDVMRLLYERYRLPKPGYDEDDLRKVINEVAMADLTPIYDQCVRSTKEVPYGVLRSIGLQIVNPGRSEWADSFDHRNDVVTHALPESEAAGLRTGDRILARSTESGWSPRPRMNLLVERDGEELALTVPMRAERTREFRLEKMTEVSERALKLRNGWLRKKSIDLDLTASAAGANRR